MNPAWVDRRAFGELALVEVDPAEPQAANALRIGAAVVHAAAWARTRERLEQRGIRIVPDRRIRAGQGGGRRHLLQRHLRVVVTAVHRTIHRERHMAESVYKVIELVGTSTQSWEKAAAAAVERAAKTLRDLRVAEVSQLDIQLKDGKVQQLPGQGEGIVQVRRRMTAG